MKNEKNVQFRTRLDMVLYFLRGSKRYFVLSVIFACLVSLFDLINPKIIGYTIDSVIGNVPAELPAFIQKLLPGDAVWFRTHLYVISAAVIVIALTGAICRYFFRLNNSKGAETLVKRMRDRLFDHIIHLPFAWHSENRTGDIIQRCTSDVEQVKMFLSEQLTSLVRITVLIVLAMYFMFGIHPQLALAALAYIPVIVGYSFFFHSRIGDAFRHADEEEGKLSSIAQENLTGVRVVRAFGREAYERERFEVQNESYTKMWVRLMKLLSMFWGAGDLFSGLQVLTIIAIGSWLCVRGELTAGSYVAFVSYNAMLAWPVRSLGRVIAQLSKAGISIDRIMYIMNSETEQDRPGAQTPDLNGDIVFDHVSYQYENGSAEILDDVSFTVKQGTTFGILGGTGSGKSTLMYLLDRLYDLPEGRGTITVNGVDIRDIKASWLRENIGMVLQEPFLFSRSLSENIRIARQDADMKQIRAAARTASLDETIEHFQEGYETFVGERGVTLSGGQKQRTAIAQMLIRKAPIMIFDDSLSAVDAETDVKIRTALKADSAGATVILIAHRITTLMAADQIIVLDHGRIKEQGTHEELLAGNGIYRQIYDLQMQQAEGEDEE
ncbi:MAG: ABC transporter ATP-binding protein [Solobacterium sp.]|nr:ABC transporter ATP-binding protein [Solobacterium sp.]